MTVCVHLHRDGKLVYQSKIETNVEPLSEAYYDLCIPKQIHAGEYCITVSFVLKEDALWAKNGHEVAFGQGIYEFKESSTACIQKLVP